MNKETQIKRLPIIVWVIAFLITPAFVFICLRISKAIGTFECLFGFLVGLLVHFGIVSVLTETNDSPLQVFIVLLLGTSLYLVFIWLYWAGIRGNIWSDQVKKYWKYAGWFFGSLLVIGLTFAIQGFHITRLMNQ